MRPPVDDAGIRRLVREISRLTRSPTRLYLTGGATAVLEGWRESTIDVDLRIEPEHDEIMYALSDLKRRLEINIELASPSDFIPELPAWRDRSRYVLRDGTVEVFHYDPYSQALSKLQRGLTQDVGDVAEMIKRGLVEPGRLVELFEAIRPELRRYPRIDADRFAEAVYEAGTP